MTTGSTAMPSSRASSAAISKFMHVAGVVLDDVQHAGAAVHGLRRRQHLVRASGEVKTSPGQAASSMPGPTKPPCIGSWPEPPPETIATLPATGASARTI